MKKLLIVEDETAILRALVKVFTKEGFEISAAMDGIEGLASALRERPDLILFDVLMPRMDGMTMLARVRNEGGEWGREVKAIAYTNLSYNEIREEARDLGIEFLVKANVSLRDVVARAREVLCLA